MSNLDKFNCLTCTHSRNSHKKSKWGGHNFYFACVTCHRRVWGRDSTTYPMISDSITYPMIINPAHKFIPDKLNYLQKLFSQKKLDTTKQN